MLLTVNHDFSLYFFLQYWVPVRFSAVEAGSNRLCRRGGVPGVADMVFRSIAPPRAGVGFSINCLKQ